LAPLLVCLLAAAPLTLVEKGQELHIAGPLLAVTVNTRNGDITSLRAPGGPEVLGGGRRAIYFDANGSGSEPSKIRAGYYKTGFAYKLARREPELIELAFSAPAHPTFAFAVELHYVVRADTPGVYSWMIYRHDPAMGTGGLGQTRQVARLDNDLFTHYFANERQQGKFPKNPEHKQLESITDATVRFPDGTIATKYNLAVFEDGHRVHGATSDKVGVWCVTPSNEYVNGGPTKQDLCVHEDEALLLRMLQSGHFLSGGGVRPTGAWTKFYGPWLWYLNRGDSPAAMWADAQRRAAQEAAAWPYTWVYSPDYPVARGTVTGKLAPDARLVLAAPGSDWQLQGEGYLFSTHADAAGRFQLGAVRPGGYTLYAWVPGEFGELAKDGVQVVANQALDLGALDFRPLRHGRTLWQVGTPDRRASEFRHGDQRRQFGLWNRYPDDFPDDVTFTVGTSQERRDWNYCQPVVQRRSGEWHQPTWRIRFTLPQAPTGKAWLLLGIAGAVRSPLLVAGVNGVEIDRHEPPNDASVYRDANEAGQYRLREIQFPATKLKAGANEVTLTLQKKLPPKGAYEPVRLPEAAVMWDCVRLDLE
jgi:rhamnogalacturonan endolyase